MKVMSLFDGMSCGRVALERAGIQVTQYIAAEIDKFAIKTAQANHPSNIQLGDVRIVRQMAEAGVFGQIDLLIGGSPCQGFSFSGKGLAFDDPRSALFFEYLHVLSALRRHNPDIKFMLENVKMKKEHLRVITGFLGVEPIFINSALVCAQNRQRYYWCNWQVEQPADRGIMLRDIIQHGQVEKNKSYAIDANYYKGGDLNQYFNKGRRQNNLSPAKLFNTHPSGNGMNGWVYHTDAKAPTITTNKGEGSKIIVDNAVKDLALTALSSRSLGGNGCTPWYDGMSYRKLTPVECERLQGLHDGYTARGGVSDTQRYKMLGNGWQVDTIEHIFRAGLK